MQINSNTAINNEYSKSSNTQQATTSFAKVLEEEQEKVTTVVTTSSVSKVEESQERQHEVLTYSNTKGMSNNEVDKYFSERSEEERDQIKYLIRVSNNFSEDDVANEVVFEEAKSKENLSSQQKILFKMSDGLFVEGIDKPPIRINNEWFQAKARGISNPEKLGIYMTTENQYDYEYRKNSMTQKLSKEEASEFFSTMANITKEWMDKLEGFPVYDSYKEDYEMYTRMSDNYNKFKG